MPKRKPSIQRSRRKKPTRRDKKRFETQYSRLKAKTEELRELVAREKRLLATRTFLEFSDGVGADSAIEQALSRTRRKKERLKKEQLRLHLAAEKDRRRAGLLHWTRATIERAQDKGWSSRISADRDLSFLHPEQKQASCTAVLDSIELVPDDFLVSDWFGGTHHYSLGYNVAEKPDHRHYGVWGRNIDAVISNTSSFEIEDPLTRCAHVDGSLAIDGVISPEDDYAMLRAIKEVQLVQYRTDKPMEDIDFMVDEPHRIYRSECGPWYRQYFPETWGVPPIGRRESRLNIVVSDIAVGDKLFVAQYVHIESENSTVTLDVTMPHPRVVFYGSS